MIQARFVPIETWPGQPRKFQISSSFRATYIQTLDKLEAELNHLGARDILIQAFFTWEQIRNDGWPKAGARPSRTGVVISFQNKTGSLSFPCDRYRSFEENVRAIALSLEALRAVNRYGVTKGSEQYQGWKRLEGPGPPAPVFATKEDAALFIYMWAGDAQAPIHSIISSPTIRQLAYREASRKLHPDQGGSHEEFVKLGAAMELLKGGAS